MLNLSFQKEIVLEHHPLPRVDVIGVPVTAATFQTQIKTMLRWASLKMSKIVCVANTHMLIEAHVNSAFGWVLENADLVTPDGQPLVWMLRGLGVQDQDRVAGMDILLALCDQASQENVSVFCVGSQPEILNRMQERLVQEFPNLSIAGMEPLPFCPLTPEEDEALICRVNASGAGLVLVSLGCPKQEAWMAQHQGKIQAVMIGLGGVFPIYAGIQKRAPLWAREAGLEWFYRLMQEPRRLWVRYRNTIPFFMWLAFKQLLGHYTQGFVSSPTSNPLRGRFSSISQSSISKLK